MSIRELACDPAAQEHAKQYLFDIALNAARKFSVPPTNMLAMGLTPREHFFSYQSVDLAYAKPGRNISSISASTPGLLILNDNVRYFSNVITSVLDYCPYPISCDRAVGGLLRNLADLRWNDQGDYSVIQWQDHVAELVVVDR